MTPTQTMHHFSLKFVKITSNLCINFEPPKSKCDWMTPDFGMKTSSFSEAEEVWKPVRVVSLVSNSFQIKSNQKFIARIRKSISHQTGSSENHRLKSAKREAGYISFEEGIGFYTTTIREKTNHVIQFAGGSKLQLQLTDPNLFLLKLGFSPTMIDYHDPSFTIKG